MPKQCIKVACTCEQCGSVRLVRPSESNRGEGRFCSRTCQNAPRPLRNHPTDPNTKLVPLTQGKVALIDAADSERISTRSWCAAWDKDRRCFTARAQIDGKTTLLHRFILGKPSGSDTDHRNRNPLDCRRRNLRDASRVQNTWNQGRRQTNKSGYKGVALDRKSGSWRAYIYMGGRQVHLGCFCDPEDAARAHDRAARQLRGEFAVTNFRKH